MSTDGIDERDYVSRREMIKTVGSAGVAVAAGTSTAAAQDSDPEPVQFVHTYDTQSDPEAPLVVETTIENPEVADYVKVNDNGDFSAIDESDFDYDGEWVPKDGVDRPTLRLQYESDEYDTHDVYDGYMLTYSLPDPPNVYAATDGSVHSWETTTTGESEFETVAGNYYVGRKDSATAEAGEATIEVITHPEQDMTDTPQEAANALAAANRVMGVGQLDEDVTAFALTEVTFDRGTSDVGFATDDRFFLQPHLSVSGGGTWFHEYVHTTENVDLETDMEWFREGYASYGEARYAYEAGYMNYQQFKEDFDDIDEPSKLSDPSTWDVDILPRGDPRAQNNYSQGQLVLAAIDREIRADPSGDADLEEVVQKMHQVEEDVDLGKFQTFISDVSRSEVAKMAGEWITSDDERVLPDPEPPYIKGVKRVEGEYPRDVNGDGLHRDIDADGVVDDADVDLFFENQHVAPIDEQPEFYDYTGDGTVSHGDVKDLYDYVSE